MKINQVYSYEGFKHSAKYSKGWEKFIQETHQYTEWLMKCCKTNKLYAVWQDEEGKILMHTNICKVANTWQNKCQFHYLCWLKQCH